MGHLADSAFSEVELRQAWSNVLGNDLEDGALSQGVSRFQEDSVQHLLVLHQNLAYGTYMPRPLTEVAIHDGDGDTRLLQVPAVRDRIVARSILQPITLVVDPVLGPASYAYRPGLGVTDAIQALVACREEGLAWVLRTDVDQCFPSVPVGLARRMLGALVLDDDLLAVVDLLLARPFTRAGAGCRIMRGLPQGCPLSPLLANLVLAQVDAALLDEGFSVIRYADDLAVATGSEADAWEAARCAHTAVEEVGMSLGADKTEVMSFAAGFCFLGEDFGPRYPPPLLDHRVEDPDRRVVYVALQGGRVRTQAGRLIIESADDAEALDVPTGQVARIVCFGSVGVSAGVRAWAMSNDVDVVFASRRGSYLGQLVGGSPTRVDRLRSQLAVSGTPQTRAISAAIADAKVRKQIVVLQRFGRREHVEFVQDAVRQMRRVLLMLPDCVSSAEVMGVEGAAAQAYFRCLGQLLPESLAFAGRSRQPPMDVANAALSYLYTILLGECVSALYAAGLDPAIGVLHADHERRPSLALDLMEEFRPYVVDQVVLTAARSRALTDDHGRSEEGRPGVLLTKAGRAAVLDGYERRMLRTTRGALPNFGGTVRRHLYRQAQRLGSAIRDPNVAWTGLSWR